MLGLQAPIHLIGINFIIYISFLVFYTEVANFRVGNPSVFLPLVHLEALQVGLCPHSEVSLCILIVNFHYDSHSYSIREYGSTLYIGLSRFPHRANTNLFRCNSLASEHLRSKF